MKEFINLVDNASKSRLEQREFLYQRIDEKVQYILQSRDFAKKHEQDSYDDLNDALSDKRDAFFADYYNKGLITDEEKERLYELPALLARRDELEVNIERKIRELTNKGEGGNSPEKKEKPASVAYEEYGGELSEINRQIWSFDSANSDVLFLKEITTFYCNVLEKKSLVTEAEQKYQESPQEFINYLDEKYKTDLSSLQDGKYSVSFPGYSIVFELDRESFDKYKGNTMTAGCQIGHTPIILIKDREGKENTLNHEENHNLSESFANEVEYAPDLLWVVKFNIDQEQEWKKNNSDKDDYKNIVAIPFLKKAIGEYTYQNFSEIIADIDRLADGQLSTYLGNFEKAISRLSIFSRGLEPGEIKETIESSLQTALQQFADYMGKLSKIFFVAKEQGETERAKGAIILFKHQEINKVENYLKHYIGEEKYEIYSRLQPLICNGNYIEHIRDLQFNKNFYEHIENSDKPDRDNSFDNVLENMEKTNGVSSALRLDNLRTLAGLLKKESIKITDEEKDNIRVSVEDYNNLWNATTGFNETKISDIKEMVQHLNEISGSLSIIPSLGYSVRKRLMDMLSAQDLKNHMISGDYSDYFKEYEKTADSQKSFFQFSLLLAFNNIYDEKAKNKIAHDKKFLELVDAIKMDKDLKEKYLKLGQ